MKVARMPSRGDLERTYSRLLWKSGVTPSAAELVLWGHWARLDPRLAEILVTFLPGAFRSIPPLELREANAHSKIPAVTAVLVDFARLKASRDLSAEDRDAFFAWARAVLWKTPKAAPQLFFLHGGRPSPGRDAAELAEGIKHYSRWGFFGSAAPLSEKSKWKATLLSPGRRKSILQRLARRRRSFGIAEYILACGGRLHRRTAERDLKSFPGIVRVGSTKAARYRPAK